MFPTTEKVKVDGKTIVCMDLTFGYLMDIESGAIEDSMLNAVENGTNLDEEDIKSLRKNEVEKIYNVIMKLTYPQLFDEDGNRKEIEEEEEVSKKKA